MESKNGIVMVSAVRTPFSKFDSAMADIPSIDLGVMVMKEVIERVKVKPEEVDDISYGSCIPAEVALETDVPARQATLLAGFPADNISVSLDRACCSSLTCLRLGVRAIKAGEAEIAMAVGAENMPRTPHLAPGLRKGARLGDAGRLGAGESGKVRKGLCGRQVQDWRGTHARGDSPEEG